MRHHISPLHFCLLLPVFLGFTCASSAVESKEPTEINLIRGGQPISILVSPDDHQGVLKVTDHLVEDFARVGGKKPQVLMTPEDLGANKELLIVGTLGKSSVIDGLFDKKIIDTVGLSGRWEKFHRFTVENPYPGVQRALVIVGSDKRGTIYGMYDLAKTMGVSPWYWWADVPVKKHADFSISGTLYSRGEPKVKYRGIFINDEAPALANWAQEKFGGFNAEFYDHVFELILRLNGNYLWPAMWGRSIYDDDPKSPGLADEYGIVLGTSHHEPLSRAHVEWSRYGKGDWNYVTNQERLTEFWKKGMTRMGNNESIVTVGMRGDGDEAMSESANTALLEQIVSDQRKIISEVTGKPASATPQMWALYKEVQEYYDKGMRVPEDVTLLLCDDNWGNIRKLPRPGEPERKGGYGIYYHFDYVGGPRNYKWINTNPLPRVWEQMNLAYSLKADRVWIVNVGDIKPMELPTSFFLDFAWDPTAWPLDRLPQYTKKWAAIQFDSTSSNEIAHLLDRYAKLNARRKPELLNSDTYSLVNYDEAGRVLTEWINLRQRSETLYEQLPEEQRVAYYQLVHFPVLAGANLNELYVTVARNQLAAHQGRATTDSLADRALELFARDSLLTRDYHALAGGKWNHMMSQTHIGYTYWQQPRYNRAPEVTYRSEVTGPEMGVFLDGSSEWWPKSSSEAQLPELTPTHPETYIEVFSRSGMVDFQLSELPDWLLASEQTGLTKGMKRISLRVSDWKMVSQKDTTHTFYVMQNNGLRIPVQVNVPLANASANYRAVESRGYIALEAAAFSSSTQASNGQKWVVVPDLGRVGASVTSYRGDLPPLPSEETESPTLSYEIKTRTPGEHQLLLHLSPTLDYHDHGGFRIGISVDDGPMVEINMHDQDNFPSWNKAVANSIIRASTQLNFGDAGNHTLKVVMIDPGVVLQRIVINTGGLLDSYLGPPESLRATK